MNVLLIIVFAITLIYLSITERFRIFANLIGLLPKIIEQELYKDAKSHFQEVAQEILKITPAYKVMSESGPDHAKHFVVGVYLGSELVAQGDGYSKQEAEEATAKNALVAKNWN